MVRDVLARGLRRLGLGAVAVAGGPAALALCREHRGEVESALVDLDLPGMAGPAVIAARREDCPGRPCCLMGGAVGADEEEKARDAGAGLVLRKPFTLDALDEALRALLAPTLRLLRAVERLGGTGNGCGGAPR